jgi:hypothetical protein
MTADEKLSLARLLDTTGDYLRDGYRLPRAEYGFTDDGELPPAAPLPGTSTKAGGVAVPGGSDTLEGIAAEISACTG